MAQDLKPEFIEQLVEKSQKGDRSSFDKLFDFYFNKIYRYIGFRVPEEDIEDLTGDVFLKMVGKIKLYKTQSGASFSAWLFRIAHNRVVDFYRKKKDILGLGNKEDEEDFWAILPDEKGLKPHEILQNLDKQEKIKEALTKLPPSYREILELKFLEDFTNKEIAEITGKREGNIRIIQLRALKEMRQYFNQDEI